jgi:Fur family transcriptional regulator, ferric uptake regulator
MDKNKTGRELFERRGLRLTPQRNLVLEILQQSADHLDAEMVFERARRRDPDISMTTVYRTLAIFKLLGLVEDHKFGESHSHFKTIQGAPHYHFTCMECGQVSEFTSSELDAQLSQLSQKEGFKVDQVNLELSGICQGCQSKRDRRKSHPSIKPLNQVPAGSSVQIEHFEGSHDFASRIMSMGLSMGAEMTVIQNQGHGPVLINIQGTRIALGQGEASRIQVKVS